MAILGFALYRGLESFLLDDVGARTTDSVERIATRELTRQPLSRDPEATPRPIRNPRRSDVRRVARNLVSEISGRDTSVVVMWPDGSTIVASSPVPDVPPWPVATAEEIGAAAASAAPVRRIDAARSPRALLTVEGIRSADGDLLAVSAVATTLEGGDSALAQLRAALVVGLLAAILLGILLGLPLTRILLRPLDRIVDAAQRISAGDRDVRVGDPGDRTEIGRLGVAFDTMVDRLEASADIQRRFVADASHELRTPLAALSGMTEMLLLGIDQGDQVAVDRVLTAMHREIARLGRLASDLLLLSQLEDGSGGRLPLSTTSVDVAALVDEVVDTMAPLTSGRTVRVDVEPGLVVVGDRDRLKQVLVNLVENAARHTSGRRVDRHRRPSRRRRRSGAVGRRRRGGPRARRRGADLRSLLSLGRRPRALRGIGDGDTGRRPDDGGRRGRRRRRTRTGDRPGDRRSPRWRGDGRERGARPRDDRDRDAAAGAGSGG